MGHATGTGHITQSSSPDHLSLPHLTRFLALACGCAVDPHEAECERVGGGAGECDGVLRVEGGAALPRPIGRERTLQVRAQIY